MDSDNGQRADGPVDPSTQTLVDSALFDPVFYARQSGQSGTPMALARHYLSFGEPDLLSPSMAFSPRFYRNLYPDIAQVGVSPLLHFIQYGKREGRYGDLGSLRADAARVTASGLFDGGVFAWARGGPAPPGLSDVEHYLVARDPAAPIGDAFDSALYLRLYPDARTDHALPLLHYLDIGMREFRVHCQAEFDARAAAILPRFNLRFYTRQLPAGQTIADPLTHYIIEGSRRSLDPAPDFSAEYYVRRYPDIARGRMDPFYHFAAFGRAEGRLGRPEPAAAMVSGAVALDPEKTTVLIAGRKESLAIGRALASTHNVIAFLGDGNGTVGDFASHSCLVISGAVDGLDAEFLLRSLRETHLLAAVLLESVAESALARAVLHAGLPSVALVCDFAEDTLPLGRMTGLIESVDRVVVPSDLVRDSLQAELVRTRYGAANSIVVCQPGFAPAPPDADAPPDMTRDEILGFVRVPPKRRVRIVLGGGAGDMRGGLDLFVQIAAEVRRLHGDEVRFLWVGAESDPDYAAMVGDMVRRLGLEDIVFFLPGQGRLDVVLAVSDVVLLPARLDPFPQMAAAALTAGRAVVCFAGANGAASLFQDGGPVAGSAVRYCNVPEAAQAVVRWFRPQDAKRALANAAYAAAHFVLSDYIAAIAGEIAAARGSRDAIAAAADRIAEGGLFDVAFHEGVAGAGDFGQSRRAIRDYVARGVKGLLHLNPRPGFNEGAAWQSSGVGPALGAPGVPAVTHRCIRLGDSVPAPFDGRVALHLHVHYPELAGAFGADLAASGTAVDLIVTTTSEARRVEVAYGLRNYRGGSLQVVVVPNRGRDIGPFLTEVGRFVRGGAYDVVGHLHGKRSLGVDADMGDRWRAFMTGVLLGRGHCGLAGVLAPFAADPKLGLLFPEDRHVVGWTRNRDVAAALAARMTPQPILPERPIFPVGTMFWARPAALEPLWNVQLVSEDMPPEPVPYDGTILHAVERILPSVCEAAGFTWSAVYRRGLSW